MRLIDADLLKREFLIQKKYAKEDWEICIDKAIENIEEAPTVEAVEVQKWWFEGNSFYHRCDNCHKRLIEVTPYCPYCGYKRN